LRDAILEGRVTDGRRVSSDIKHFERLFDMSWTRQQNRSAYAGTASALRQLVPIRLKRVVSRASGG